MGFPPLPIVDGNPMKNSHGELRVQLLGCHGLFKAS
jgi:hypothetical protein